MEKFRIDQILEHIDEVIAQKTEQGKLLWHELQDMHPADSAQLCTYLKDDVLSKLFLKFSKQKQLEIFEELPNNFKEKVLKVLNIEQITYIFNHTNTDDLTDLFDTFSDEDLKKSLEILHKKDRQKVLSLLKFSPDSAGGIMTVDVVTLEQDLTVTNAVSLLQRLKPNIDLHRQIYVTDKKSKLMGYINLEDLLTRSPQRQLSDILREVPYVAQVEEDQEVVAQNMVHYSLLTVPVVNDQHYLLGVIPEEKLIDVIKQEAIEDAQKMSGAPVTGSYFDLTFFELLYKRSFILAALLLLESITSFIMGQYEHVMSSFFVMFVAMLVSTGGNTSGQTSAIAIQAMSSGDINKSNLAKFLRREIMIGFMLALILSVVSFARVYAVHHNFAESLVVSTSLGIIVLVSVLLGAFFPVVLKKIGLDPAFSAGPLLATVMDIFGIFIYCYVAYLVVT